MRRFLAMPAAGFIMLLPSAGPAVQKPVPKTEIAYLEPLTQKAKTLKGCRVSSSPFQPLSAVVAGGSPSQGAAALNNAKKARIKAIACPELDVSYEPADTTVPSFETVLNSWYTTHALAFEGYSPSCPLVGRHWSSRALGAYAAARVIAPVPEHVFAKAARQLHWTLAGPHTLGAGADTALFGAVGYGLPNSAKDACKLDGAPGTFSSKACGSGRAVCLPYVAGDFARRRFVLTDHNRRAGWYDGAFTYDHLWSTAFLIECATRAVDPAMKSQCAANAALAGRWALREPAYPNANYTARLVQELALLYGYSGHAPYRDRALSLLDNSILPALALDLNKDGYVDGVTPRVAFSSLHPVSRTPGRAFDGHNSLMWYHSLVTHGVLEVYVALRDRGDRAAAERIRPIVIDMLDNLASEIVTIGVPPAPAPVEAIPPSLLAAIWKIGRPEALKKPLWDKAAWALWNRGTASSFGLRTQAAGLYLLVRSDVTYKPPR